MWGLIQAPGRMRLMYAAAWSHWNSGLCQVQRSMR